MSNISDFFSNLAKREEQSQTSGSSGGGNVDPKGSLLDLCYKNTRGTSILRPIMDINNFPLREINDVYDLYEVFPMIGTDGQQIKGEDGRGWTTSKHTFIMGTSNYKVQLTPEQITLHNNLMQVVEQYRKLVDDDELIDPDNEAYGITTKLRVNKRWKITLFWAKVLSLTVPTQGCLISDSLVRLCRHHGSSFRQDITNAITAKTQMKGGDGSWQDAFFNRNVGPASAVMSVGVVQQQGFKNTIQFEENGPQYQITDVDLQTAGDLFAAGDSPSKPLISGLNATMYPHAEMQECYNRIVGYLNAFAARSGVVSGMQPQQAPAAQPAAVAPTAQPVVQPTQPATMAPQPVQPQVQQMVPQPVVQPMAQPQPVVQPAPIQPMGAPVTAQPVVQSVMPQTIPQPVIQPVIQPVGVPGAVPTL